MRVDREIIAVRIALSTLFNIVNDFTKNTESFNCGWALWEKMCTRSVSYTHLTLPTTSRV